MRFNNNLQKYKSLFIIFGFSTAIFIGISDFVTDYKLGFSVFYLVPIMIITWLYGKKLGIILSLLSSFIWLFLELYTGKSSIFSIIPYLSTLIRLIIFSSVTYILSAQVELERNLHLEKNLARKDILTGAANRRMFFEIAERELYRSKRYKHPISLAYIDLDNFKQVNDTQGHNIGDKVLKTVVEVMKKSLREIDVISRLSGDEFVVLFPNTNFQQIQTVVNRTQKNLLFSMKENNWGVTFSIGVVTFVNIPKSADEMIKVADNLMYEVKKNGKNNVKYIQV